VRIAFYAPRASYLEPGVSGDQVLLHILLAALRERDHRVEIVSQVDVRDFWCGRAPARRLVTEAISIRKRMKRFAPDAWLVYGPAVTHPDLFGWWQCPRHYLIWQADTGEATRLPRRWRWLLAFAHRRSLGRAHKVAVHRPRSAERLRSFGVPDERLCILLPAVKTWDWMPSQEEARQRLGLPQEVPVILCVSRFTSGKDGRPGKTDMIVHLLAAVAPLPSNVVLVVVGDGHGRRRLEDEAAKLSPEGRVRFAGFVEHEHLIWYYAACDFFAFPDLRDFPRLAILEAQASGRPVVTMHTDSAELTVEACRTGLLAKTLDEFQTHVASLARDKARCQQMGQAGREYIAKFHSIEIRVRQMEELLFEL
jgi:phosphatidylinositol alpha-1,6-mannosyltransferase